MWPVYQSTMAMARASPDGVLFHDGQAVGGIEIKCPFSCKEKTIEDACKDKGVYLQMTAAGPKLKVKHQYFYQCQGIMNIIGLPFIDFVVFTMQDFHVERIHCDQILWLNKMLPKLTHFFEEFIL